MQISNFFACKKGETMWIFLCKHVPNGYGLGSKRKWTHSKLKLEKVKANMFPSLQNGFTLSHNKISLPTGQTFVAHLFWEEVFFWGWVGDYSTCSKLWSLENFHTFHLLLSSWGQPSWSLENLELESGHVMDATQLHALVS